MSEREPARQWPSISIVINTLNRADRLRQTLESFSWLNYEGEFEVVVVNGPSSDGTEDVLVDFVGRIKVGHVAVANLSVSRNEGIRLSDGEIVAFLDDDAIPEPAWLTELAIAYDSPGVGAAGGYVYDHTGYSHQYRYGQVDRYGQADLTPARPRPDLCYPGSFSVPHMLGTNSSYLRSALVEIGGYDEFYEYYLDETDVQLRIVDAGFIIAQPSRAVVHHHFAESSVRTSSRVTSHRYAILKNRLYFAIKHARDYASIEQVLENFGQFVNEQRRDVQWCVEQGYLAEADRERFESDVERATDVGLRIGLAGSESRVEFRPDVGEFLAFEAIHAAERKRVVFISQEYPPDTFGGIGTFTKDLATSLASMGHDVHVLSRSIDVNRVDYEEGVWVHRLVVEWGRWDNDLERRAVPAGIWAWSKTCLVELDRISESSAISVVETPIWDAQGIAILRAGRFPLVVSLQTTLAIWLETHPTLASDETWMAGFGTPVLAAERELMLGASAIRAISRAILEDVQKSYAIELDPSRAVVAALGVAEREILTRKSRGARVARVDGRIGVLFVGRVEARKGVDVLLEAFARAYGVDRRLQLNIVGDDTLIWSDGLTMREMFEASERGREVGDAVRFLGVVSANQLAHAYSNSDMFVAPSRYESFGLVFVEAMRHSLPLVGTNVGGIPEVVEAGVDGYLVEGGDVIGLADAILTLAADDELRESMGHAARSHYEVDFTAGAMAARSISVFDVARRGHQVEVRK
jgi:glycogen synthase